MQKATATFTVATATGVVTVEAGALLADDAPAVAAAPHLFKPARRPKAASNDADPVGKE